MSRSPTRRKCRHCSRFFLPDPRTVDRQRYCSQPGCQHASQRRWLSKDGNGDYFRGPRAVERVQAWRKLHPGYWRKHHAHTIVIKGSSYRMKDRDTP